MSEAAASTRHASDFEYKLPTETAHIWARLTELLELGWPTLAEQTERRVLVRWLNPTGSNSVTDTDVLTICSEVTGISLQSAEQYLLPAYIAAKEVGDSLFEMANGESPEPARPLGPDHPDREEHDAWREVRRAQAFSWWATTMRQLDRLFSSEVVDAFEMPESIPEKLMYELRMYISKQAFDGPAAIGASMWLEPSTPGLGFGNDGETIYVMEALTQGVTVSLNALARMDLSDIEQRKTALMRLDFFWSMLKGFTWASTSLQSGSSLAGYLFDRPDIWDAAKAALIQGREAINASTVDGKHLVSFGSKGSQRYEQVMQADTMAAIQKMDDRIAEAQQNRSGNRL